MAKTTTVTCQVVISFVFWIGWVHYFDIICCSLWNLNFLLCIYIYACFCAIQACHLQNSRKFDEVLDERLNFQVNKEELERLVKVSILCTNASPSLRPNMSEVVSMLEGQMPIPDVIPQANTGSEDLRFKAMREFHRERKKQNQSLGFSSITQSSTSIIQTDMGSSSAASNNEFEINLEKTSN